MHSAAMFIGAGEVVEEDGHLHEASWAVFIVCATSYVVLFYAHI